MKKVEFKKNFDLGYAEVVLLANYDQTKVRIKNTYSVPSSTITSTIINIDGTLFQERKWGFIFYEMIEIHTDLNAAVQLELEPFEVDEEDFDEDEFLGHLIYQATKELKHSILGSSLKRVTIA